jgi:hypothetical protein
MNTPEESRRLVLASGFANTGFPEFIASTGWEFLYTIPPGDSTTTESAWRIDPDHTFHYFECANYPVEYCLVAGPRYAEVLTQVSTRLDFMDVDDLISAFDRSLTADDLEVTTFTLGLTAGRIPEAPIYERIRGAMHHELPRIRLAAIDAAFVTGWDLFREDLKKLSTEDSDFVVRQTATNAIADASG